MANQSDLEFHEVEPNVDRVVVNDKEIYLVGTAHISEESVALVEKTVKDISPDTIAIELCAPRYESLKDPEKWKNTDIIKVIKDGKISVLMAQLVLASFQRKIGKSLNVRPGAEMIKGAELAETNALNLVLADREVKTTLKRTWAKMGLWSTLRVGAAIFSSLFVEEKISAEEIERIKSSDVLEDLLRDFAETLPDVRRTLIDERDQYLSAKIKHAPGRKIVAIVGAGHIPGVKRWLSHEVDIAPLEKLPPKSKISKVLNWIVPALFFLLLLIGFFHSGAAVSFDMVKWWIVINAGLAGLGALAALSHPFTIISAAISAPFTTLHPLLASGTIACFVEAMIRKPLVRDLEQVADDIGTIPGIYRNRLSRIFLVFTMTNLFGSLGALFGFFGLARMV